VVEEGGERGVPFPTQDGRGGVRRAPAVVLIYKRNSRTRFFLEGAEDQMEGGRETRRLLGSQHDNDET